MSTTKTVKVQKNKVLTYSINKTGFQTVNKSIIVSDNVKITENLVSQSGSPIQQLGDRLLGISTYVCDFTPSGTYDTDSLKFITASQTTGTGLSNIQVVKSLWLAQIETALSVETPKGSSNTFTFTYNGSIWDLTGAVSVSGISATDLSDVYGISFTGTPANGDVITVVETHYNKFACYVLDSNYRNNLVWCNSEGLVMPIQYSSDPESCVESATYFNDYIKNNFNSNDYPAFNHCKNLGTFIMPNNVKINAVLPNTVELQAICNNKIALDSFDPVIQAGGTDYNLTNWNFQRGYAFSCVERTDTDVWRLYGNGVWNSDYAWKGYASGIVPIFEVPVM